MEIACLAWGSLVWDPRELPIRGIWFSDGPLLPVEFTRRSTNGRITLVLTPSARLVRALWGLMAVGTLDEAIDALCSRECIPNRNKTKHIGSWPNGTPCRAVDASFRTWVQSIGIDAVIWTNLPPKFDEEYETPSVEKVVKYLQGLSHEKRRVAEEYVRRSPPQIDTDYRRRIEAELGWRPIGRNSVLFGTK